MTIIFLGGSFAHVWTHKVFNVTSDSSFIFLFFLAMWTKRAESEDCTRWLLPSGRPRSCDRGHYPASSSQVCLSVNHSIFHIIIVSKSLYSPKQTVTSSNSFVHAPMMTHMKVGQISCSTLFLQFIFFSISNIWRQTSVCHDEDSIHLLLFWIAGNQVAD